MAGGRLIDRVRGAQGRVGGTGPTAPGGPAGRPGLPGGLGLPQAGDFAQIKRDLHNELIESLDFEQVGNTPREELQARLRQTLTERVEARQLPLNRMERERLVEEILDNILGLGPLEPLLRDPEVSDIMINGPKTCSSSARASSSRRTSLQRRQAPAADHRAHRRGGRSPRRRAEPDGRRPHGGRLAVQRDHPAARARRAVCLHPSVRQDPDHAEDLVALGLLPAPDDGGPAWVCALAPEHHHLRRHRLRQDHAPQRALVVHPDHERIITIEDSAELQLQQNHVVRLETRPANLEGKGEVTQRDLVKNCLRMRPDRIILGEIRGGEAIDMLTAMNTGHDGSLATVHANNTRDALARFETMVGIGMPNMGDKAIRETIARALDLIVQQERLSDGSRRIMSITEVTGMEGPVITSQDIFVFEQRTIDEHGKVRGAFRASGIRPRFATRLASNGIRLAPELFRFEMEV
jgi:pilus assembly protein CpaF